jgi:predicted DNA-binding antitoxin AbrB/MazE fold protein
MIMNNPITAIYENGILRPIAPLNLPEQAEVKIVIEPIDPTKRESSSDHPKPTMAELWADLDKINKLEPDIELPARKDRSNPLLENQDEFFV